MDFSHGCTSKNSKIHKVFFFSLSLLPETYMNLIPHGIASELRISTAGAKSTCSQNINM